MIITHQDISSIHIATKTGKFVFNPSSTSKKSIKPDALLVSVNEKEYNGIDRVKKDDTFIINRAGEYEVKGAFIYGISMPVEIKGKKRMNVMYVIDVEDIRVCVLGLIDKKSLTSKVIEEIGNVDIVITPIDGPISVEDGYRASISLSPSIIIPTNYNGNEKLLNIFAKSHGDSSFNKEKSLSIRKTNLPAEGIGLSIIDYS